MNLRSPSVAMLWENWRLTRVEAVQRFALGLVAGALALVLNTRHGATIATWALLAAHGVFWLSIAKLNGGRFIDGYKPGFPFYLLYTRPVSTWLLVGVPMLYDAVSCAMLYAASAALLGLGFGKPLPVFTLATCVAAYHLVSTFIQWSTRNRVFQWVGTIAVFGPLLAVIKHSVESPLTASLSAIQLVVLFVIGVLSYVLAVAGVARQRRGETAEVETRKGKSGDGYPAWLINRFRVSCPTSSATRAQVWFELKSAGFPVLSIGASLALLVFLLFAAGIAFEPLRQFALGISFFGLFVVLFVFGGNAFGIRGKQGRQNASAFEVTQPYVTAQMAGLKILVRSACVLGALLMLLASLWLSSSLMQAWDDWMVDGKNGLSGLLGLRSKLENAVANFAPLTSAALATLIAISVVGLVTWQAAREALKSRYPRAILAVTLIPMGWGLVMVLLALLGGTEVVSADLVGMLIGALFWVATAVLVLTAIYLLWRNLAEHALTGRYALIAAAFLAAFGLAYGALLQATAMLPTGKPAAVSALLAWPLLLLVIAAELAPWALRRVRHV
jgi:hypothetical protein